MMENKTLKPCPFCGGDARIVVLKKGFKSIIVCTTPECGRGIYSYNNGDTDETVAQRLTAAWNRRTNDAEVHSSACVNQEVKQDEKRKRF